MKKLLFLSACLWALNSSAVFAQAAPSVAIVSVWYTGASQGTGHLSINRDGKAEVTDVLGYGFGGKALVDRVVLARAEALRKATVQLYSEGYVLKAALGKDDLIFVKEK